MTLTLPLTQLISGATSLYGIMGYPIAHSWSPLMHTFAFRYHARNCLYVPFLVAPERLAQAVAGAVALGVQGFNVTIPHKEAIMAHLDEVSEAAQFVGAVNTVVLREGRTIGYNTDGEGFLQPLHDCVFAETSVCLLGAGGAARAVSVALLQAGCRDMIIANRTYERGQQLATTLQQRFPHAAIRAVAWSQISSMASHCRLIVNTTSVGLHENDAALLPMTCFHPQQIVYDVIYRPTDTPLLATARQRGATVIPGLDMLIGQGAVAFQMWTGLAFPVAAVRQLLRSQLQSSS